MILKEQQELNKIRKGDIRAFEALFHRHYNGMLAYARSLVKQDEVAEEVVQDVFYNIWKNRVKLNISRSVQSYLYRSVYNNSMMVLRRSKKEIGLEEALVDRTGSTGPDPAQELQYKEVSDVVDRTLEELPEKTREIFLMNRQDGLRYREIAEKLSISVKTVEAHMGRALKALRFSLTKHGQQ